MNLDTFLTTLYVWIDDWYNSKMETVMKRQRGPSPQMSDSEVLTVAIAGQWRKGVPWDSERGVVRYMQTHGRHWFPKMLERSRFNERVRHMWAILIQLQQDLSTELRSTTDLYEMVDCVPVPSCSNAQSLKKGHWLWWGTRGHGGTNGSWYWGDQMIMSVTPDHVITGWLLGPARADDRAMMQLLISQRQGAGMFLTPDPWRPWRQMKAPTFVIPLQAAGLPNLSQCYLADKGFNGYRWQAHWYHHYGVSVLTEAHRNAKRVVWSKSWSRWFRGLRQGIETVFSVLSEVFALKRLKAHSRWGQITRIALGTVAHNWGIWLNRRMGRPDLSHATLIC